MKLSIKKKPLKYKWYEYVIMALLIMLSDSLWFKVNISPNNYYFLVLLACVFSIVVLANAKILNKISGFKLILLMISGIIIAALINRDTNFLIVYKIALIVIGLYLFMKWNISKFADIYVSVIVFIAIYSLIIVLNRNFIIGSSLFPTLDFGEYGTKTAFFSNIRLGSDVNNLYFRNQGPFWEPGAFQAYLNIAVIFQLFLLKRRKRIVEIIILTVTLLSTFSTTGIITLSLLYLIMIIEGGKKDWGIKLINYGLICIILGLAIFNSDINDLLFNKFDSTSTSIVSSETRKVSILINLKIISEDPFLGYGISKSSALFNSLSALNNNIDANVNTTTSLYAWAIFGIMYATIYNYSYLKLASSFTNKWLSKVLLFIAFLIILNTEDWTYSILFNILPIYALMLNKLKNQR